MSQTFEFYDSRAREAAKEARDATLENVRQRSLRAEKTWRGLAEHARAVAEERAKIVQDKAEALTSDQAA